MGKTSLDIKRNINISSDTAVFIGDDTGEYAQSQTSQLQKVDLSKAWQVALGSVPSMTTIKGTDEEAIKAYIAQVAQGSIPTVVGSSEAFNPANWKNGDVNSLFADSLYRGGISGVHTGAATTELNPKTMVLGYAFEVGWVKDNNTGKWKYFNQSGEAQRGWKQVDGKWYYFNEDGFMQTGWIQDEDKWYYLKSNGEMATSEWMQDKEGKWYYLRSNGEMATSEWRQDKEGKWYYLRSNGEMAVSKMISGEDGNNYYLGENGDMLTDSNFTWEGKEYRADSNGVCEQVETEADGVEEKIKKFMQATAEMGNWYAGNINTYLAGSKKPNTARKMYNCEVINMKVGDDCSSFVSSCLVNAGIVNYTEYSSYSFNPRLGGFNKTLGEALGRHGFVWHEYTPDYVPKEGDISVQHKGCHHVEIIASYNGDNVGIWSWGKVYSSLPANRTNIKLRNRMSGYWRLEN